MQKGDRWVSLCFVLVVPFDEVEFDRFFFTLSLKLQIMRKVKLDIV
jgi:hypothetical protein